MVKNPPAMWETWVQFLGWEDPLQEGMATHSSILAWRISMDRGAWQAAVHWGCKESDQLSDFHFHLCSYDQWEVGGLISSDLEFNYWPNQGSQCLLSPGGLSLGEWGQKRRQSARPHPLPPHGALDLRNLPGEASAAASSARPPLAFAATIPSRMAPEAEASQVLRRSAAS